MKKNTKSQKTHIEEGRDKYKGERSPYWDWAKERQLPSDHRDSDGVLEPPQANPDMLPETEIASPSTPQLLMGEAIAHLQGRQKEVYLLTMREGRSIAEAAEMLGITKGSAQKYRDRAIRFISQHCHSAIEKGRV